MTCVERKRNSAKTCFTYVTPGNEKVFAFAKKTNMCEKKRINHKQETGMQLEK